MNYRHIYHAGSFADVVKHLVLLSLLNRMCAKDKSFAVLDAFAGLGLYDLESENAQKTGESDYGIRQLLNNIADNVPNVISQYISIVKSYNNDQFRFYPGSPIVISYMLREFDRLIACELHKEDYAALKQNIAVSNINVHNTDAYHAVKAFWPPKEGRGLILLDPPFEVLDEFNKVLAALSMIKKRFQSGMTMVWYPIKNAKSVESFYDEYKKIEYSETLILEFSITKQSDANAHGAVSMNKFGILISNPPNIQDELNEIMQYLTTKVYVGKAKFSIKII